MNRNKRFDLFIIAGFSFLIVMIIVISVLSGAGLGRSKLLFRQTYQDAFQRWVMTEQANGDLIALHRAMKDVALSKNDTQLQAALDDASDNDAKIQKYFDAMKSAIQADDHDSALLTDAIQAYNAWAPIRALTVQYTKNGQYELAGENTRTAGSDQVRLISGKMQLLINEQKSEADTAYKASEQTASNFLYALAVMAAAAVILAVLMSLYIRNRLLRFQRQLFEEKEKLQITFDSIGDGIITVDTNKNVLDMNRVSEQYTGWTAQEVRGKPFAEVFAITNAFTGDRAKDPVAEVLATDSVCLLENHTLLTSRNGMQRHIADSAAPIKDENGRTSGVVMIFRDVTERKIAEAQLKESEQRFRAVFEQAPIGISLSDVGTGRIIDLNDRFAEIVSRTREELQRLDWMSLTHPDDLPRDLELVAQLNNGEISGYRMEKRYLKPDGSAVWIDMSVTIFQHSISNNLLNLCMIVDITQQKLAENELRISEERLRTAQSIANVGNWEIDPNNEQAWASEQALKIYGITSPTPIIPARMVRDAIVSEDRPERDAALLALWEENAPYDIQFGIRRADDGALRYIHSVAVAERDANGKPLKLVGIVQDITTLINAELDLKQSKLKLEATLQATADGIEALDTDGRFIFSNEKFKQMWELPDDFTENGAFNQITRMQANPNTSLTGIHDLLRRLDIEEYREIVLKDGRTYERFAKPIREDEHITGYVLSYRDISEKKRTERALLASEAKLRAMIDNISETIVIVDETGHLRYVSPNMQTLFGWSCDEIGKTISERLIYPDDLESVRASFAELAAVRGMKATMEFRLLSKYAGYRHIRLTAVNMTGDPDIQGILMNFRDISDKKTRENEILYLNYHDLLTGLFNRAFFEEECERLDVERQLPISVIMGDINGLKLINDAFGHKEGDKLLIEISKILSFNSRREDILARTGGDEFCILLPQTSEEDVRNICRRIYRDCINYGSREDKDALYLSISLGCATKTDMDTSIARILTEAEESMYKQKLLERKSMRSSVISSIKSTMYAKNHLTTEHEERLVALAKRIGQKLDLTDVQMRELELLSTLHDLGKLSIGDQILNKPGRLTEEEWIEVKKHPEIGYRIAQASPELAPIAEFILSHHERWDGGGYPQGLRGGAIPLLSRIVAIVDAYDAMTQDRPYRGTMLEQDAVAEIEANAGTQFDPELARLFADLISRDKN